MNLSQSHGCKVREKVGSMTSACVSRLPRKALRNHFLNQHGCVSAIGRFVGFQSSSLQFKPNSFNLAGEKRTQNQCVLKKGLCPFYRIRFNSQLRLM